MRRFDELPRDAKGHPIEGHLVQGSWWWWATQATLAGFEVDPVRIRRVRRRWGANSRWWNLYVCRRRADIGPDAIRRRMDRLMGSAWEPLRQRLNVRRIAAGRLIRRKNGLVLSCRAQDPGAYAHFGPGVRVENGRVDCRVDFRLPAEGRVVGDPAEALFLEVSGSHGVHETRVVTTQELLAERGKWIRFHHEHRTRDESGIEFRIYHTGAADLEIGWPVRCEVS
jgi:hypothetical protein